MRRSILFAWLVVASSSAGPVGCKRKGPVTTVDDAHAQDGGEMLTAPSPAVASAALALYGPCLENCRLRAKELGCPKPESCDSACTQLREAKHCAVPLQAFMKCFLKEPTDHWQCSDEGVPEVKDETCEGERGNVIDCLHTTNGEL